MSESEEIKLYERINDGIVLAQKRLYERKMKLGQPVVIADSAGRPQLVEAAIALDDLTTRYPHI